MIGYFLCSLTLYNHSFPLRTSVKAQMKYLEETYSKKCFIHNKFMTLLIIHLLINMTLTEYNTNVRACIQKCAISTKFCNHFLVDICNRSLTHAWTETKNARKTTQTMSISLTTKIENKMVATGIRCIQGLYNFIIMTK